MHVIVSFIDHKVGIERQHYIRLHSVLCQSNTYQCALSRVPHIDVFQGCRNDQLPSMVIHEVGT